MYSWNIGGIVRSIVAVSICQYKITKVNFHQFSSYTVMIIITTTILMLAITQEQTSTHVSCQSLNVKVPAI